MKKHSIIKTLDEIQTELRRILNEDLIANRTLNKDNHDNKDLLIEQVLGDLNHIILTFRDQEYLTSKQSKIAKLISCFIIGLLVGNSITAYIIIKTIDSYQMGNMIVILLNYLGIQ
jgi:hypothetical protein